MLLPFDPVIPIIGVVTNLEKISISPVTGTPARLAATISDVFKFIPGLTTNSLAFLKVSRKNPPTSYSVAGNCSINADNPGGSSLLSTTLYGFPFEAKYLAHERPVLPNPTITLIRFEGSSTIYIFALLCSTQLQCCQTE